MKKIIGISLFLFFGLASVTNAQVVKKTEHAVKTEAKKVGNKTAEVASKGKSKITDEKYKGKEGPNGETIYIDNHSKYYWVDKKGHRTYVTETELRNKIED
jgi:hypothetical protein